MLEAAPIICPILPLHPLPRITADLPGFGGQLKVFTEDFVVEELPLYEPAGSGDHLYLWIEKVDVAAETLRRHIARMLEISGVDVGMAGLKDRRAITRQWISVPRSAESKLARLNTDRIKVLDSKLHRNKLRTAHLRGNRFEIRVRHVLPGAYALAQVKIERLLKSGVPNFYGSQRMGHGGSTLAAGWALLRGQVGLARVQTPNDTVHTLNLHDRHLRRLAASALQSELFNRTVALRMERQLFSQVLDGDACQKTDSGGTFVTDDIVREQLRFNAGELQLTGPMWGTKMLRAQRDAMALEGEILRDLGVQEADFAALSHLAEGTRRPIAVVPQAVVLRDEGESIWLSFELPAGGYATEVLYELIGPSSQPDLPLTTEFGTTSDIEGECA